MLRRQLPLPLLATLALTVAAPAAAAPIDTVAGSVGEGPATTVAQTPTGLAVVDGRLLVADETFAVVRALDLATGRQTLVAGNGSKGARGDGGPATAAQFAGSSSGIGPQGIAVDADGRLLVADPGGNRVRLAALGGVIATLAGTGTFGFTADGGPADESRLGAPYAVAALPGGAVAVADTSNNRIRRVAPDGTLTTLAGSTGSGSTGDGGPATSARLNGPRGLAVAPDGDVLIADTFNNRVRRVDSADGTIATVAGSGTSSGAVGDGGPAIAARLVQPVGLAIAADGDLLVAERTGHRVRRVDAETGLIATIAGTGTAGFAGDEGAPDAAQLNGPTGLALAGDRLFVADTGNRRVRVVDLAESSIATAAGNGTLGFRGDGGPAREAQLQSPFGVAVGPDGDTYVADTVNHRIRRIDARTRAITTVVGDGTQCPPALQPADRPSAPCGDGGRASAAQLSRPFDVAVDPGGNVYWVDNNLRRIRRADARTGTVETIAGTGEAGFRDGPGAQAQFDEPQGLGIDAAGTRLLVGDAANDRVREIDLVGAEHSVRTAAGSGEECTDPEDPCGDGGTPGDARLTDPVDAAYDPAGGILVADPPTRRVRRIDPTGTRITTVVGTGESGGGGDGGAATQARLRSPRSVTVASDGTLYVADAFDHRVRQVDPGSGIVSALAGAGRPGDFGGDGGPAAEGRLNEPSSVAVDPDGGVLVADRANQRIRRVAPEPPALEPPTATPPAAEEPAQAAGPEVQRPDGAAPPAPAVPTPGASPSPAAPGPSLLPRRRARGVSFTGRLEGRLVRTRGRLLLPARLSARTHCSEGVLSVQVKRGRVTISSRRLRLRSDCSFAGSVRFRDARRLGSRRSLRVVVRFAGNRRLLPTRPRAVRVAARAR